MKIKIYHRKDKSKFTMKMADNASSKNKNKEDAINTKCV